MDSTRLKLKVEVAENGVQIQQPMPPPTNDWNNQYSSPDAEDMGPFVEQLLPYVRASAYNWFHLQAAKRRHFKDFDRKMSASDENRKLVELQNDRDDMKVKWASRLLGKLKKDIQNEHKDAFVQAINGVRPMECILSVADQKGKMRRIDCLRQADKVWRLDLVTIILFKGIPLESTDGERLERCESCTKPALCINPFHMAVSVRTLDVFMANYLKDIETKITLTYVPKKEEGTVVKLEPGVPVKQENQTRAWKDAPPITLEYDPQRACHTYFGGRSTCIQQSSSNAYSYFVNKDAVDNNYYDAKRSVLCLPPPPAPGCLTIDFQDAGSSDSQQLEISEDSNDEPLEKRSRDLSSHGSPNSSTNDEIRRIVETGESRGIVLGESSTIWSPLRRNSRMQPNQNRPVRLMNEYLNEQQRGRSVAYRAVAKPVRRMTVNAGNHGDVGVIIVDARNQDTIINNQNFIIDNSGRLTNDIPNGAVHTIHSALNSRISSPVPGLGSRKRGHTDSPAPLNVLSEDSVNEVFSSVAAAAAALAAASGCDVSPPHPNVTDLMNRPDAEATDSPTKFTTARGNTMSFRNAMENVEKQHEANAQQEREKQKNENGMIGESDTDRQSHRNAHESQIPDGQVDGRSSPSYDAALAAAQLKPAFITTKIQHGLPAPVAIKPPIVSMSACNSIRASPIGTPYRHLTEEEGQAFAIGLTNRIGLTNSNDSLQDNFLNYIDSNSRSPILTSGNGAFTAVVLPNRPDSSASNGSNSLQGVMGFISNSPLALAAALSPLHPMRMIPPCSPSSSNSSSANQAPVTNAPKDPNAPKLPTDFSQAIRNEKK